MSTDYLNGPVIIKNTGYNEVSLWLRGVADSTDSEPSHVFYIARKKDTYPIELANDDSDFSPRHVSGATHISGYTDYGQERIYSGKHLRKTAGVGSTNSLTDTAAFGAIDYSGRILRDSSGNTFRITSNTANILTFTGTASSGEYVILADFPSTNNSGFTGTVDSKGGAGPYTITSTTFSSYTNIDLQNRTVVINSIGYIILYLDETADTIYVATNPGIITGLSFTVIDEYSGYDSAHETEGEYAYLDEDLEDNQYYYYTIFCNPDITDGPFNVEFDFANVDTTTQGSSISVADNDFVGLFKSYWPSLFKSADSSGSFDDLMEVFGYKYDELYAHIYNARIKDEYRQKETSLPPLLTQLNIPEIKNDMGYDTHRRILTDMIEAYKLKGTKEGIAKFIRILTTWDITGGTFDYNLAIDDTLSYVNWIKLWALNDPGSSRFFSFFNVYDNATFVPYTYNNTTGIITYTSAVDLSNITAATGSYSGDFIIDGFNGEHYITAVSDTADTITASTGLIDLTKETGTTTASAAGSIIDGGKAWTANEWIDAIIFINGYAHRVTANSGTQIYFTATNDHGIGVTYYIDDDAGICTDDDGDANDSGSIFTIRADERSGRFPSPLPGAAISGHFAIREFTINIPDIALYVGDSTGIGITGSTWTLTDSSATFPVDKLINAYLIPKIGNPEEMFQITDNTGTTIDFLGDLTDSYDEGSYVVLSQLNARRLQLIIKMLKLYIPYFSKASYNFTITV